MHARTPAHIHTPAHTHTHAHTHTAHALAQIRTFIITFIKHVNVIQNNILLSPNTFSFKQHYSHRQQVL